MWKSFGDWEMDLIVDSYKHCILTLVERSTNMLLMEKLPHGRKSVPVAQTVIRLLIFTDAYSSWQKGCIENTNKLIRKYIPKGANFARYSDDKVRKIQQ